MPYAAAFHVWPAMLLALIPPAPATAGATAPTRAAYFYNYMPASHVDSIAARGFDRAVIHWITDSLGVRGTTELRNFRTRGAARGVDIVPQWALQAPARLRALPTARRYTWGSGTVEADVGCPADSLYWRSTLLDRAGEILAAAPGTQRLAVDLEIYFGSIHHYDRGPCRCSGCIADYLGPQPAPGTPVDPRRLTGLLRHQEQRIGRFLAHLLAEFAAAHPGVEIGVFDLDYDSFVHRALARGFAQSGVPTASYCERSYSSGGGSLPGARVRLDRLGLAGAPLIGGLWLKRFTPRELPGAVAGVLARADGYFVFTTFSLWLEPEKLTGPYTLPAAQAEYWRALAEANQP